MSRPVCVERSASKILGSDTPNTSSISLLPSRSRFADNFHTVIYCLERFEDRYVEVIVGESLDHLAYFHMERTKARIACERRNRTRL